MIYFIQEKPTRYHPDPSLKILRENLDRIATVTEWAAAMGYTRTEFYLYTREQFGRTPYQIIKKEKYQRICSIIRKNPNLKGYCVARRAGFSDSKALYKFLSHHYGTTLTEIRLREEGAAVNTDRKTG